jgi:NADH-quinone oxidoreductase subunit H
VTLADGIKLFFKEGITPTLADKPVYAVAPILAMAPAFLAFAVIPFGTSVTIAGREVPFQIADLNIGILWILAMASLNIYAVVLAGWSSGSNYPLLGGIRASAQMISYEVGMGLALVAVLMYSGTLRMSEIVASQDTVWNVIPQFPAFVIYLVAGLAETNRPPFDLAEADAELVGGYNTEYGGGRFAAYFAAEYLNVLVVSGLTVTLFLGGWSLPFVDPPTWVDPIVVLVKMILFSLFFIWVRATLPRLRYDQLMSFGWKILLPLATLNALVTAILVVTT